MFGFGKKRKLKQKQPRVAVLVADGVEQAQLDAGIKALRAAEAEVFIVSPQPEKIRALKTFKTGANVPVDATLDEVHPASFGALFIPGGTIAADKLRTDLRALEFVRSFDRNGKPIAAIGHAGLVLASAGVARDRTVTAWPGIHDDLVNAGAQWADEAYITDEHVLTGRASKDLRAFTRQLVKHFGQYAQTPLEA